VLDCDHHGLSGDAAPAVVGRHDRLRRSSTRTVCTRCLQIQLDNNDEYLILVGDDSGEPYFVGTVATPGLQARKLERVSEKTFAVLSVFPLQGDGNYSIGSIGFDCE
jgi:hypothetical protein